ncbi:MAG: tetratricopeptide repeat protein [bacterium]|nr:tetratricopeptide repeat protein [bacterium]
MPDRTTSSYEDRAQHENQSTPDAMKKSIGIVRARRPLADAESLYSYSFRLDRRDAAPRRARVLPAIVASCLLVALGSIACDRNADGDRITPLGEAAKAAGELSPHQITRRIEGANRLIEATQFQAAVDLLMPVVSLENVPPTALAKYGLALLKSNKPSLALWALARAAEGAPPESDVVFDHAQALFAGGDAGAAIRELDRLIALVPATPRLIRLRAHAHKRHLTHEKAVEDLDLLIGLVPGELTAHEARIELLKKLDRVQEAREAIAELGLGLEAHGGTITARGRHCAAAALFEHQQDETDRARRMLLACLEVYPAEPDVVLPWILFLDAEGEEDEATAALEKASSGAGRLRQRLRIALADRYSANGRREDATRELNQAAEDLDSHQPLLTLADHRVAWEDFEGAREAVHRAVERQVGHAPGSPDFSWSSLPRNFRFAFGDILIRANQHDEAAQIIESLEEDAQEVVFPLLLNARLALERGTPEKALSHFEESFQYWPSNVGARYLAGRAAMEIGDFDRGMSLYQDAFRADPRQSDAGLVLTRMQIALGRVGAAIDSLSTLLGETKENPEALRLFGNLTSAIGAFEVAEGARIELVSRFGWRDQMLADQAAEKLGTAGREAAIAGLENAGLFEQPGHHESLFLWFRLKAEGGEPERTTALDRLSALRTEASDSAGIELAWARIYRSMGEPEKAITAARLAVERDPKLLPAGIELGRLLLDAGEPEEAASAFQRVLDIEPSLLGAVMGRADAAMLAEDREEAERRYRRALVEHPWHSRAARALARIGFERDDFGEQTLVWARWAARFNEGDPASGASLLAELRLARSEPREAAAAIAVAIESTASVDPRLSFLMGRALVELGERNRAAEAFEEALRVGDFPEAGEARDMLAALRSEVDQ